MKKLIILCAATLFSFSAWAVVDGHKYQFDDPQELQRFTHLAENLRCPKCQNQSLADSDAPVAADMRDKVYELMQQGQDNQGIVDYMVARYGDFVRYSPPMRLETFLLWFGPALFLLFGLLLLIGIRRNARSSIKPLSAEEQARLQALTNKADAS